MRVPARNVGPCTCGAILVRRAARPAAYAMFVEVGRSGRMHSFSRCRHRSAVAASAVARPNLQPADVAGTTAVVGRRAAARCQIDSRLPAGRSRKHSRSHSRSSRPYLPEMGRIPLAKDRDGGADGAAGGDAVGRHPAERHRAQRARPIEASRVGVAPGAAALIAGMPTGSVSEKLAASSSSRSCSADRRNADRVLDRASRPELSASASSDSARSALSADALDQHGHDRAASTAAGDENAVAWHSQGRAACRPGQMPA